MIMSTYPISAEQKEFLLSGNASICCQALRNFRKRLNLPPRYCVCVAVLLGFPNERSINKPKGLTQHISYDGSDEEWE